MDSSTVRAPDSGEKLDPSQYLSEGKESEAKVVSQISTRNSASPSSANSTTLLRRRINSSGFSGRQDCCSETNNQMHLNYETIIPLTSDGCSSKDRAVYETLARPKRQRGSKKQNLLDDDDDQTEESADGNKIFSIANSVLLIVLVLSTVIIFCLCTLGGNTLLVNAHYSVKQESSQQQSTSAPLSQQYGMSSTSRGVDSRQNSIDRFDDGEQIRPPLVRQPTTLPPLRGRERSQDRKLESAQVGELDSLQTAATDPDTYLSPESRDMFLKDQENHYEGKTAEQQQPMSGIEGQSPSSELAGAGSDGYESPSGGRWSSGAPSDSPPANVLHRGREMSNLGPGSGQHPHQGGAVDAVGEEADDEDEAQEQEKNLVPEKRRVLDGSGLSNAASYNHQHQRQFNRPMMDQSNRNNADSDGDSNDDYGGAANDDAYFSRKSTGNNLNPAASHNQQNRNSMAHRGTHQQALDAGPNGFLSGTAHNEGSSPDESAGFGPGPNEAYMVDKAESSRAEPDEENDGLYGGGPNDMESAADAGDDDKLDRRSMAADGAAIYPQQPMEGEPIESETNADEPSDSSEESAPSLASSTPLDLRPRNLSAIDLLPRVAPTQQARVQLANLVAPKTAASAPAQLATPPMTQHQSAQSYATPLPQMPRPRGPQTPPLAAAATSQASGAAHGLFNRHQSRAQSGERHPNLWQQQQQQYRATQAPYNPQNNPSHAGKYFIN